MPPPPTRILINGAGVAGPAFAAMLLSSSRSYAITVVERAEGLRTGGQQVDLRSHGLSVARRMGIMAAVGSRCVKESGVAFVDGDGHIKAVLGVNDTGRGQQTLTSEYEIMRGDLVDVLYRASLEAAGRAAARTGTPAAEALRYEFGKHATELLPGAGPGHRGGGVGGGGEVGVRFSDGSEGRFDLVVGADGQGSRTRRLAFGAAAARAAFRPLGVCGALYTVARDDAAEGGDPRLAKVYHAAGRRVLATRTGDAPATQAALGTARPSRGLADALARGAGGLEDQRREWAALFRGAGWQAERLLEGLRTTGDFYSFAAGQVKMERWSKDRVVMLGDAGYCPSPMTGMGTTCALVGGYVLAGELARHGEDIDAALQAYEKVARPFIDEAQKLPTGWLKWWYRETDLQIRVMHMVLGAFTKLRLDRLLFRLMPQDKGGLKIPSYPELEDLAQLDAAHEGQATTTRGTVP